MPAVTIIAAKVFAPKPGKKRGTVVTPDEVLSGAMPPVLAQIKQGGTYDIIYKNDEFNGVVYKVIEEVKQVGAAPAATSHAPTAIPSVYNDPVKSEQIAVLALVKPWIEKIPVGDAAALEHAIRACRVAWKQAYAKSMPTKIETVQHDDMNDELPEAFR